MVLATFIHGGKTSVGAVHRERGQILALPFASMLELIAAGDQGLDQAREIVQKTGWDHPSVHKLGDVKLRAPVPRPESIRDFSVSEQHIRNAGAALSRLRAQRLGQPAPPEVGAIPAVYYEQPIYYKGNRFNVVGPGDDVIWPAISQKLDFELEFGIFIKNTGKNIPLDQAKHYIFGYTCFNDFSARDTQEHEMTARLGPAKGKDFDTGNALGPWIVTPDEITDACNLTMITRVNGEEWTRSSSSCMLHTFEDMIAFVSLDETLYPGEFFGSGTAANGCGLELDRWIQPGDVVEIEVEGIGTLRNRIVKPG